MQKLSLLSDNELFLLRAGLDAEMRRRKIAFSVGGVGEQLAIEYFNKTPGLPKLLAAPRGTKNVDAISRDGERLSIKTICKAKKTGTVYPDMHEKEKQLFEHMLIVKLTDDWSLEAIYRLPWAAFVKVRSWDKRMNAWYVGITKRTLGAAELIWQTR